MPWPHDVHPEFGYLCLAPPLRRALRRTLACVALGTIAAAVLQSAHHLKSQRAGFERAMAAMQVDAASGGVRSSVERAPGTRGLERGATAAKAPCGQAERSHLGGMCESDKAPKMRVVRVPAKRPAIAAGPIGRVGGPAITDARVAAAVETPEATAVQASPSVQAALPEPEPAARPPATARKPRRSASNRRREQGTWPAPAWREVRADAWSGFAYGR